MEKTTKRNGWLIVSILLVATTLRMPFTSIPPIIQTIATSLHVSVGSLGILTTLPILAFAFISPITPLLARKYGVELTMMVGLLIILLGSGLRIFNGPGLLIGTTILGIGIAIMNVLVPVVISKDYPNRVGAMTAIYITTMAATTAIGSASIPKIAHVWNWQTAILVLTAVVLLAFLGWLPNLKHNAPEIAGQPHRKIANPWRNPRAWYMLLFGGIQSLIFYTGIAWLPTIAVSAGLSAEVAGSLAGLNALIGVPVSLILPNLLVRIKNARLLLLSVSSLTIVAFVMALFPINAIWYWLVVNLLNGIATASFFSYYMTSIGLKTRNADETVSLSGMSQSGGYLIAAVGPVLMGILYNTFGNWNVVFGTLIVLVLITLTIGWQLERHQYVFKAEDDQPIES